MRTGGILEFGDVVEPDGLVAEHFIDLFAQLAHRLGVLAEVIECKCEETCVELSDGAMGCGGRRSRT